MDYKSYLDIFFEDIDRYNDTVLDEMKAIDEKFFRLFSSLGIILAIISLFGYDNMSSFSPIKISILIIVILLIVSFIILVFVGITPKGFPLLLRYPAYYEIFLNNHDNGETDISLLCEKVRNQFKSHRRTYIKIRERSQKFLKITMIIYVVTIALSFVVLFLP